MISLADVRNIKCEDTGEGASEKGNGSELERTIIHWNRGNQASLGAERRASDPQRRVQLERMVRLSYRRLTIKIVVDDDDNDGDDENCKSVSSKDPAD